MTFFLPRSGRNEINTFLDYVPYQTLQTCLQIRLQLENGEPASGYERSAECRRNNSNDGDDASGHSRAKFTACRETKVKAKAQTSAQAWSSVGQAALEVVCGKANRGVGRETGLRKMSPGTETASSRVHVSVDWEMRVPGA